MIQSNYDDISRIPNFTMIVVPHDCSVSSIDSELKNGSVPGYKPTQLKYLKNEKDQLIKHFRRK